MADAKSINVQSKPTAAFILTLIGGIFVLLGGIVISFLGAIFGGITTVSMFGAAMGAAAGLVIGLASLISGIIIILAAIFMNSTNQSKVKTWSIIALVFAIVSLIDGGGFVLGFLLALIGSILGLTYKG